MITPPDCTGWRVVKHGRGSGPQVVRHPDGGQLVLDADATDDDVEALRLDVGRYGLIPLGADGRGIPGAEHGYYESTRPPGSPSGPSADVTLAAVTMRLMAVVESLAATQAQLVADREAQPEPAPGLAEVLGQSTPDIIRALRGDPPVPRETGAAANGPA